MKASQRFLTFTIASLCAFYFTQSASGKVVYVSSNATGDGSGSSWENACRSISAALKASMLDDEIWVASGRYREAIQMKEGVALYGGFSGVEANRDLRDWETNATIIDAPKSVGTKRPAVTGANDATLDGFTITGGERSGVHCYRSSPTLVNCTISGNTGSDGGGVSCYQSSLSLTNCTISGNAASYGGGVHCGSQSSPTLANCRIAGNTASNGGGVYCQQSYLSLTNCTIIENRVSGLGGGVYCNQSSPLLTGCTIGDNSASLDGGGIYCISQSSPVLVSCMISGNTAADGGGMSCKSRSSPTLAYCTISGNQGGGVSGDSQSSPTFINCILWNRGIEIEGIANVKYSCIQGGWPGDGNIRAYPEFVDPTSGDYHLQNGSPCIDRGLVLPVFNQDSEGRSRPGSDGLADMGAYESPPDYEPAESPSPRIVYVHSNAADGGDGLSWERAFRTIGDALFVGDEIRVAGGTYCESVLLEEGVAVYGGFSGTEETREGRNWVTNETTIDATGLSDATIICANDTILDGFTITGGGKSGVYCNGLSTSLRNCTIVGNTAKYGGGIYCSQSSPTLTNCTIVGN
ncbi:MAG: right-handed parallel beta-helix repeat-containing protein, partial [bacterium]